MSDNGLKIPTLKNKAHLPLPRCCVYSYALGLQTAGELVSAFQVFFVFVFFSLFLHLSHMVML